MDWLSAMPRNAGRRICRRLWPLQRTSLSLSLTHSNKRTNDSDTLDCQSLEDEDDDDDTTFVAVQSVQEID